MRRKALRCAARFTPRLIAWRNRFDFGGLQEDSMTIFCKTKAKSVKLRIETGIASLPLVAFSVTAQVPSSITGKSFGIGITGGTSPFAGSGYYLFLPASSGNRHQVIGIYNVANSSGTYSYSLINSTTGSIQISDSIVGASTVYVAFSDANTGVTPLNRFRLADFKLGTLNCCLRSRLADLVIRLFFLGRRIPLASRWNMRRTCPRQVGSRILLHTLS